MTTRPPRVVHVIAGLHHGGAEVFLTDLLPRLRARGIDATLVSLSDANPLGGRLASGGVSVATLGHRGGTIYRIDRWMPTARRLRVHLERVRPDIVHSHLYMCDVLARMVSPAARLMTTLHGPEPWWSERVRLRSVLKNRLEAKLARRRSVRFIAISLDTVAVASKAFGLETRAFRVIPPGIDVARFQVHAERWSNGAGSRPVAIQVGRMYPEKGHQVSLEAFARVLKECPDASLVFAGDGPLRRHLEAEANRLGLGARVEFLGVCDDIPSRLDRAHVFWMPSRFEGFGLACAEAMAAGLPTVTPNVTGLRDMALDGVTGFVVAPDAPEAIAEATLRILRNPALARQMGLTARRRAEECFSVEKRADDYVKAYQDVLSGEW